MIKPRCTRIGGLFASILLVAVFCGLLGQAGAQEKSFLWQLQSANSRFYIVGSIHFMKKEHYPLKKVIEDAFDNVKKLVLEIDLPDATTQKAQAVTAEKGIYRDGTTLRQNIPSDTYALAERRAKDLGIEIKALNSFKPWVVALMLTSLKLQQLGFDPNHGIDRYLAKRAKQAGKETAGLETLEFQVGLLDQLSKRNQEMLLRQSLNEITLLDENVNQIVQFWSRGDLTGVEKLLLKGMQQFPELHQKVFAERNRRWLGQIERLIAEGLDVMVVVGAGHLVGKDGIIELLKQRGYTMEQL